jgi:hypothetical protein
MSRFDVISLSLPQRVQTRNEAPCRSVRTHLCPNGQVQKQRRCVGRWWLTAGSVTSSSRQKIEAAVVRAASSRAET